MFIDISSNEAVATTNLATSKSASEMENHVFAKANSKEEYLGFIAKLILHVRGKYSLTNMLVKSCVFIVNNILI